MISISSKTLMLAGAAFFSMASAAQAQVPDPTPEQDASTAQTPPGEGEIVVTGAFQAFRGTTTLRELPQATQTISNETLLSQNITRLDTALDLSASVSRQNSFGGIFDSYSIRGFQGDPDTASGFLINGFNGSRGYGGPRDASSVETIEILRGPTSALFGRGEPGGTVNIVTKKPFFGTGGYVSGQIGRFDNYRGEVDLNTQITDISAFRITGAYEQGNSFRDTLNSNKIVVTPSILLKSGGVTASYELEYIRQRVPFDRGVTAINGDPSVLPRSRFLGEPADGNQTAEALGHQFQLQAKIAADWRVLAGLGYRETWYSGFGEDPEFGAARNPFFTTGRYLSRRRIYRNYETQDLIPRAELSGVVHTGSLKHNVLLGVDYEYFKLDVTQNRFRPPALTAAQRAEFASGNVSRATRVATNTIDIFNPEYFGANELQALSPFLSQAELATAWGVYFRDRIEVTDWFALQGGVRYDNYKQTVTQRLVTGIAEQQFTQWSPSAGFSVDPLDGLTFYGSYSKGFRANTGTNVRNQAFKPEVTNSYEVGTKFEIFDDKLSGTIALFKMKKSNLKTADPVNAGFSLDVGEAKSKGLEVDLTARLPAGLAATVSYAYIDAEIAQDILDPDFGRTIFAGDPLIGVPKNSISGTITKDFEIGERVLNVGGSVKYTNKRLGETATQYFLPAYTLVRVFGSIDLTEHLKLTGDVANLFDKKYFPSSYAALWTMPGTPREWRARLTYKF